MKKMYEQAQQTKDGEDFDCEKEAKEPRKEAPAKESAEKQGASSCGPCVDEDSPTEEYLKDVGESVADMLGPLGRFFFKVKNKYLVIRLGLNYFKVITLL